MTTGFFDGDFLDIRFPEGISKGVKGGPRFKTSVVPLSNGGSYRISNWGPNALRVWDCSQRIKNEEEHSELLDFYYQCWGRKYAFRFKDWSDYEIYDGKIADGDGVKTTFPVYKVYGKVNPVYRRIGKLVADTVTVYLDGIPQDSAVIDHLTGKVTLPVAPPPGSEISVDCEFDVMAVFASDSMDVTVEDSGVFSWDGIGIEEIPEND